MNYQSNQVLLAIIKRRQKRRRLLLLGLIVALLVLIFLLLKSCEPEQATEPMVQRQAVIAPTRPPEVKPTSAIKKSKRRPDLPEIEELPPQAANQLRGILAARLEQAKSCLRPARSPRPKLIHWAFKFRLRDARLIHDRLTPLSGGTLTLEESNCILQQLTAQPANLELMPQQEAWSKKSEGLLQFQIELQF